MSVRLICLSHSPLMDFASPPAETERRARAKVAEMGRLVADYQPDLTVIFGPDHFNGFFHDLMPPACIGIRAEAAGDWDMGPGQISVDEAQALALSRHVLSCDVGVAHSYRMTADHGVTQPLLFLTGGLTRYPVVPIVINSAAPPLASMRYAAGLGRAVGSYLKTQTDKKILIIGSGGLSHDPPTPQMATAPEPVREFLIAGRNPTAKARQARQERIVAVGKAIAEGDHSLSLALNPQWDQDLLQRYAAADFAWLEAMQDADISRLGGRGGHEIRCWTAAFAALSAFGPYQAQVHYYEPIQEWLAGFGIMSARPLD